MEIRVAADLWGRKENLRLTFDHAPSLEELHVRAESVYAVEVIARRPPDMPVEEVPPFRINAMTILVDDETSRWVDLVSSKQLYHNCQAFVFQPPHPFHSDNRDLIPTARDPLPPYPYSSEAAYREEVLRQAALASRLEREATQRAVATAAAEREAEFAAAAAMAASQQMASPPPPGAPSSFGGTAGSPATPRSYTAPRLASPRSDRASTPGRKSQQRASSPAKPGWQRTTRGSASPVTTPKQAKKETFKSVASAPAAPVTHARPVPTEATHLDLAHEVFASLDRRGDGNVSVGEIKAALVTAGLHPANLEDASRFDSERQAWQFPEWLAFCEANPHIVTVIADRRGIRPAYHRSTHSPPRGLPAGSTADPASLNRHRDLSPQRSRPTEVNRQRAVAERLSGGLASVPTARDRQRGDVSHAHAMLPVSPTTRTTPGRSPRTRTPTRR